MTALDDSAERAALELYEDAPCGLVTTESGGTLRRVNRTFCAWVAYPPDELVGRRRLQDLLTMGSRLFHQTHWMPLLQIQGSVAEVQVEFVHRDGRVLPMLANAVVRAGASGVSHDFAFFVATDRRKYERELILARKRAEELLERERAAQEALAAVYKQQERDARERAELAEQLVGIVSHDLRNPLNAVLLGAHTLARGGLAPAQERIVGRITSAANRATRLIADLLDFTQARLGGGLRVERREMDLHALVVDCVEELKLAWPGRMIDHRQRGDAAGLGDPDRLAQVVSNLANNALTYGAPDRPVTITSAGDADALELRVHNVGPAIPEALLPHIFEPLRRGENQVKLGSRSVGLGLYIVHEITRAHCGDVTVRSTEGEGTCFTVRLPRGDVTPTG